MRLFGMEPEFIHLRVRSSYSLLEGALPISRVIELCQKARMPAVALTDTNNLFGALEFSQSAAQAGVQPILGCTLSVDFSDAVEKDMVRADTNAPEAPAIAVLAKDAVGYANLMQLASAVYTEFDGVGSPSVPFATLCRFGQGLLVLSGGPRGALDACLAAGQADRARARLRSLREAFPDRFYVEIQRHGLDDAIQVEAALLALAYEHELPLVATNDAHFVAPDDYEAHDALICVAAGEVVSARDRRRLTPQHWFKPVPEMAKLFADLPEALANTVEISRRCAVRARVRAPILPSFGADTGIDGMNEARELQKQSEAGLRARLAVHGPAHGFDEAAYWNRLAHELSIIANMEFPGYFLIVADIIKWAKGEEIPVGPGRGSGAGSLVAWSLTITDLDPLMFGLLFERFLNPERVSMPDFDIDFCPERRDEVINYIREKYGHDRVAQIITFGKLQARAVLRDVGRVLQMPYGQVDRLCRLVPNNPANPVTLAQAIAGEAQLREERERDPTTAKLLEIGLKLEGLYRHASTHAAGVVIADRPLAELVPLYRDPRSDMLVTQFNMKWVEQAGLVKFDILGLKTLTVLQRAIKLLRSDTQTIDLATLPLDDEKTYQMLARGETVGVFQFESAGMRDLLVKAVPTNFEDLIALVALFRPGPMENIPKYLACKHGREDAEFLHETIVPVVADTYGVIIYQEQVMQIAQVFSGYSLGDADLLRRAMGKKIKQEMDAQRTRFVQGAADRGVKRDRAEYVFELVAKFAGYGFNKCHSAAYALVAYQTAYLKANHPVEFLAALMTLDLGNTDKLAVIKQDATRAGIELLPPSINASGVEFSVSQGRIRYALPALKNVGRQAVIHIVEQRQKGGRFASLGDFASRIDPHSINRRALESLVRAGAFDELNDNRAMLLAGVDRILSAAQRASSDRSAGQNDLFGESAGAGDLELAATEPWSAQERLGEEFAAVGFYLSGHPLDAAAVLLAREKVSSWRELENNVRTRGHTAGRLAGIVVSCRARRARSGNRFAFVVFSDPSGQFEAVVFSDTLSQAGDLLETGKSVVLNVEAELEGEMVKMRVQSISPIDSAQQDGKPIATVPRHIEIYLREHTPLEALASRLDQPGDGTVSVVVLDGIGAREIEVRLPGRYLVDQKNYNAIKAVSGVVVQETG
ncbi:MAG: DNA polymerase III subunit alpha [Alphaproteobacteria bacterium]